MDHLNEQIVHLFLPKRTPNYAPSDLANIERSLLHSVNLSVSEVLQKSQCPELNGIKIMLRTWEQLQPTSNTPAEEVRFVDNFVHLTSVQRTPTIPVYIRKQNCTVLIEQQEGEDFPQIKTFRAALPSELVTGSVGPLSMSFPETSDIIQSKELLSSRSFASSLFQLAVNGIDISTKDKGRDVAEPFLVTQLLVPILSPGSAETTLGSLHHQQPKYSCLKKIRDQVTTQGSSSFPFRRSGMWLSIKVAVQLQLLKSFQNDPETSKLVYKLLILRILADLCKAYYEMRDDCKMDLDLVAQMLAKVGRRVRKLEKLKDDNDDDPMSKEIDLMRNQILAHVHSIVGTLHQFLKQAYETGADPPINGPYLLPLPSSVGYLSDLVHIIPFLSGYQEPNSGTKTTNQELDITVKEIQASLEVKRYPTLDAILSGAASLGDSYQLNERIWLYDTETYMKTQLDEGQDSEEITKLFQTYVTHSLKLYQGNPIGLSQMILVLLKAVQILDRSATKDHPLLLEYQSGINCATFDCLILPHQDDMKLLSDILNYFNRRNLDASTNQGILTGGVDENSFPVRFAAQNQEMIGVRDGILLKTEENIGNLFAQLQKVRDLQDELKRTDSCSCRYCMLVKVQNEIKDGIKWLERPLPAGEVFQNAVIFEELIPQSISDLRNCLAILKFDLLEEPLFKVEDHQIKMKWLEYGNLISYLPWKTRFVRKTGSVINLGSRNLNSLSNRPGLPDIPTSGNESFVRDNGLQCIYSYGHSYSFARIQPITQLRLRCAFQISDTFNSAKYLSLQPYLQSYEHTQNEVIASQNLCHGKLDLEEFKVFGSIRAGRRIQLRNLYRAISSRELSLEEEPVLALLLQTIWQVGPSMEVREAHLDFEDERFCSALLEVLEGLVKENQTNYNSPLILLAAVAITVRIMELNGKMDGHCYSLLKRWRSVIKNWTGKLEAEMMEDLKSSELLELQQTLLKVRICSAFSYNFSPSAGFRRGMRDAEDICEWFHTISILNQGDHHCGLSKFMLLLLNVAKNVALRLQLESQVMRDILIEQALGLFVSEKWSKEGDCIKLSMKPALEESHENLILLKYEEKQEEGAAQSFWITFDFILGTFLVNGLLDGRLDAVITGSPIFKRYFRHHTQLRVQKESENVFRTVARFHGRHYEFRKVMGGDALIKEIGMDGTVLTLLEHEGFRTFFNPSFVDNYSHWLDLTRGVLYFRTVPREEADYTASPEYKLIKTGEDANEGWKLYCETNRAYLMSVTSTGFKDISTALGRLELCRNVNVLVDERTEDVTAHLPRYGLRFVVNQSDSQRRMLECMEYPGFFLSSSLSADTLLGLEQGIQLESEHKRKLIIPNGNIRLESSAASSYHQRTLIDLEELRQPPYFVYEFDEVLKRLVADKNKPAWLHLAALHAVTSSSSFPDPFTGLTGTETAVRILQTGFIWSSGPYDEDSLRILNFIKGLSPKRTYSGNGEVIQWPEGLSPMAAYDGFEIIVDKLIEDGGRLEELYYVDKEKKVIEGASSSSSAKLRLRSYFRHLRSYNQGVAVKQEYFSSTVLAYRSTLEGSETVADAGSGQFHLSVVPNIAWSRLPQFQRSRVASYNKTDLFQYLATYYQPDSHGSVHGLIQDILKLDFRTNWFHLYNMAKAKQKLEEDKHRFTILLSVMAFKGAPIQQLWNLHYISEFADQVDFPAPGWEFSLEEFQKSTHQGQGTVTNKIKDILFGYRDPCVNIFDVPEQGRERTSAKERRAADVAASLSEEFSRLPRLPDTEEVNSRFAGFQRYWAVSAINNQLGGWHNLAAPRKFAEEVQAKLNRIYDESLENQSNNGIRSVSNSGPVIKVGKTEWKCDIRLDDLLDGAQLDQELWDEAHRYFRYGRGCSCESGGKRKEDFMGDRERFSKKAEKMLEHLLFMLDNSLQGKVLGLAGLLPRLDPTSLLQTLIIQEGREDDQANSSIVRTAAGGLSVIWTIIKRLNRCLFYIGSNQAVELERELGNGGHGNWSPRDYPEWVLLELELDIMIRPVQVDVANRMMNMPDGGNGIMQLNMGEGKTSVIVPMLCSTLSRKGEQLCRVTVLGSIFNMNYATLSFAIGGLLNRRVYTVPCKRDMAIDGCLVDRIQTAYEECMEMKGTVLTLPEYRLSFRLLAYDKILRQEVELGLKLHQTENWLRENARDVLDEADELLNVKYQLIYTIGNQIPLDGGDLRWTVCQKLLQIVQQVGKELFEKYGTASVELDVEQLARKPHQFAPIRLLNSKIFGEFVTSVADRVLEKEPLTSEEKTKVKRFLTEGEIAESELEAILKLCGDDSTDSEFLQKILVTSGYLRRGVLTLGLSKRWRVEYGVDTDKSKRLMAVPFRAKDVAAERTEFGHPDLAILLTHLSYYYSGLSYQELGDVLKLIKKKKGGDAIYSSWIQRIPADLVPSSIANLQGINLKDSSQIRELFKLLRKHKAVIDFWLSNKVFPKEAREFPSKLVMTAWDLCTERQRHPITGFSGTNDSSVLLPLPVTQQDLPSLENTNGNLKRSLLQPKNRGHRRLEMGVSCREILEMMKEDNLTVLIDAGALMLECSNEQLASLWLDVNPDLEATLYFDDKNYLMGKSRGGRGRGSGDVRFELSSFKGRLEKCGVFLDDQHTRGTDIKFPIEARACVTVGGRMKRDKLIQACMRMRKLELDDGGHSVSFYVSHEASGRILAAKDDDGAQGQSETGIQIQTKDVLEWVRGNTKAFNEDGLLYWATSGLCYAKGLAAEDNFAMGGGDANVLGEQCKDDEVIKLVDLYGKHVKVDLLGNIIPQWFNLAMSNLIVKNNGTQLPEEVMVNFNRSRDEVVGRCLEHVPNKLHFSGSNMEEEQERELEPEKEMEVEEEVQIERAKVSPAKHTLHKNVVSVVLHGGPVGVMEGIERICDIFKDSSFWDDVQPEGWGDEVYATTDFITVIADKGMATDDYLRPIEYVISGKGRKTLLLLSPFEVNELMPWFRSGNVTCHLHMFSPRRSENQDLLLNEPRLLLPMGVAVAPVIIAEDGRKLCALLLASGNLYFRSMAEQRAFALFASLAPLPWSEEEKKAVDQGLIRKKSAFMMPQYRRGEGDGERPFAFGRDPSALIRRILTCRHAVLSDMAHVIRLLNEKTYVDLCRRDNDDDGRQ